MINKVYFPDTSHKTVIPAQINIRTQLKLVKISLNGVCGKISLKYERMCDFSVETIFTINNI